jgi:uncharacterized membrane protein YebE (DUF533 family)
MIKEQLKMLIQLAVSDSMIAEKEKRMIYMVGTANGVSKEEVDKMIENPEPMEPLRALSDDQKFEYIYQLIQLMKTDGQVFRSEISFCEDIAEKLGYDKRVVGELSSRIYSDPSITADRDLLRKKAEKLLRN